ncbi:MAG: sigma-54-dependent Fis family transcriptional regulator [Pirellulales bacterium]|nr:sigma-54-dependent Fis family transcriptional regulator [Pirellulales bacterium]
MTPRILVISGDRAGGLRYYHMLSDAGYDVHCSADPALGIQAAGEDFDVTIVCESSAPIEVVEVLRQIKDASPSANVVVVGRGDVSQAVAAMKEGAVDYLEEPCSAARLRGLLRCFEQPATLPERVDVGEVAPDGEPGFEGMIGQCPAMREVFTLIGLVASTDSTVLLTGESGTGKEMVVRAIHRHSRRRDCPLLACDCTALAPTLLESELFGHVKGSFSGAIATKMGLIEVAHQGTLFLDEVGNLSLETQGKLLRILETRRVRKVGDTAEREVDIRLIATSNRSLAEMVKAGEFRADLYYRLNVLPIVLPPLRERIGDVPLLASVFLRQFSRQMGVPTPGFSPEAVHQLELYAWPGNVRELRNIVERLTVLYGGSRIGLSSLPWEIRNAKTPVSAAQTPSTWEDLKRVKGQIARDLERRFLMAALDRSGQNITKAAKSVGMQRSNFHALLRSHGLRSEGRPAE